MIARKEVDRVRNLIRRFVIESGREVLKEHEKDGRWVLPIKHGVHVVYLQHASNQKFMTVVFITKITDEEELTKLSAYSKDSKLSSQINFTLKSVISSPTTAYDFNQNDGRFAGFNIMAKIFPFDKSFALKDFEPAIQSVVTLGVLGNTFLATILGDGELDQESVDLPQTSPGEMFR